MPPSNVAMNQYYSCSWWLLQQTVAFSDVLDDFHQLRHLADCWFRLLSNTNARNPLYCEKPVPAAIWIVDLLLLLFYCEQTQHPFEKNLFYAHFFEKNHQCISSWYVYDLSNLTLSVCGQLSRFSKIFCGITASFGSSERLRHLFQRNCVWNQPTTTNGYFRWSRVRITLFKPLFFTFFTHMLE